MNKTKTQKADEKLLNKLNAQLAKGKKEHAFRDFLAAKAAGVYQPKKTAEKKGK